jgi:23S rRNA (adenine2503-C2)-methyltransferase
MNNFFGTPEAKFKDLLIQWDEKPYRANQVFAGVYHRGIKNFDEISNISKSLRQKLKENFVIELPEIAQKTESKDGTIKYLFKLTDGATVESVWMPSGARKTLCISTQVGCRLACTFCLTGTLGLKRNLTAAEITGQYIAVKNDLTLEDEEAVTNIVVMGMGEPLDNYQPVVDALRLMVSPEAMRISTRKITLSTSGLVDKIEKLKGENLHVNLAISLNATDNSTRDQIMPINKKYPIEVLLDCLKSFPLKPTRRITFEYVMLRGINDSMEDAKRLVRLLHGIPSKINLIPFNPFLSVEYQAPADETVQEFQDYLIAKKYSAFVRKDRGADILGACGQLAAKSPVFAI